MYNADLGTLAWLLQAGTANPKGERWVVVRYRTEGNIHTMTQITEIGMKEDQRTLGCRLARVQARFWVVT